MSEIEDDIDAIKNLSPFRATECPSCKVKDRVHALQIYMTCKACGTKYKTRAFGGIGTEIQDVIETVLEWAGISREEVIHGHESRFPE